VLVAALGAGGVVTWNSLLKPPAPRFLTSDEAELVAVSRFTNFSEGAREFQFEVSLESRKIAGSGVFDYASGAGIARLEAEGEAPSVVWWDYDVLGEIGLQDDDIDLAEAVDELGARKDWRFLAREDAVNGPIGAVLVFIAGYGFDRPDNPKLIEQSDAVWLEATEAGIWVQLPSADEVRAAGSVPVQSPLLPSVLVSSEGRVEEARIGRSESSSSTIRYGVSSTLRVPRPAPVEGGEAK
jgi:hypothetical protein